MDQSHFEIGSGCDCVIVHLISGSLSESQDSFSPNQLKECEDWRLQTTRGLPWPGVCKIEQNPYQRGTFCETNTGSSPNDTSESIPFAGRQEAQFKVE